MYVLANVHKLLNRCVSIAVADTHAVAPGDTLEHACCVSIKQLDEAAMERAFEQLKVFYADTRCAQS